MFAEWSAECGVDAPVLVVPWADPDGSVRFIDLRADAYDAYLVPEAEQHPPLLQALRALNVPRSPVFTAKCDVWPLDEDELAGLRANLEPDDGSAQAGYASYIDMVWRDRGLFGSRHRQEQRLDRLVRQAQGVDAPLAALECVLRPAVLDFGEAQEGYAVSLYVKATGTDAVHAEDEWARALAQIVMIVRSRDFAVK